MASRCRGCRADSLTSSCIGLARNQVVVINKRRVSRVRLHDGYHRRDLSAWLARLLSSSIQPPMTTEIRNWDIVAKAMEAAGTTSSQMYIRAKALAEGKTDPMPTSFPAAPFSISAVAG